MESNKISVYDSRVVGKYERFFAKKANVKHTIATNNGTAALHSILSALKIKSGDEVIVSGLNYISVIYSILYLGAQPVILDIELETLIPSIDEIKKSVTGKTKAIITTANYGFPSNTIEIRDFAKKKNIFVVEDLSQSFGLRYKNKPYGVKGDIGFLSTSSSKNLSTSEGGIIITNNKKLADSCKKIINLGQIYKKAKIPTYPSFNFSRDIDHAQIGFTYRMSPILAAIGISQLKKNEQFGQKRKEIFSVYRSIFNKPSFIMQPYYNKLFNVYPNGFPLIIKRDPALVKRVIAKLQTEGWPIYSSYYSELFTYSSMNKYFSSRNIKNLKYFHNHNIILPVNINATKKNTECIANAVINALEKS
jgi:dTDP-4-amino-4,6-dideoxygalactose transaminase